MSKEKTKNVLPFANPVTEQSPDQLFFNGIETFALSWGIKYPSPESLPEGLHAYWCEPWEDEDAQAEADAASDCFDRHESTIVFAAIVTDHRTEKSDTYIVATTELPLGKQLIEAVFEPCCVGPVYNEVFLPLLDPEEYEKNASVEKVEAVREAASDGMKRYRLLESWHNGGDNGENEVYAESRYKSDLVEIMNALHARFLHKGLGDGFSDEVPNFKITDDGVRRYWLGDPNESLPEFCRNFRIVEVKGGGWDFAYEEEIHETLRDYMQGVITDNCGRMLFYRAYPGGMCRVYASIAEMVDDGQAEVEYPWNAENDSILLDGLNSLEDPDDFFGEGSPIRVLVFKEAEECE